MSIVKPSSHAVRLIPPALAPSHAPAIQPPASKSISNRALLLAAQSRTPVILRNVAQAADTRVMLEALTRLGLAPYRLPGEDASWRLGGWGDASAAHPPDEFVSNRAPAAGSVAHPRFCELQVEGAGTALRFLTAFVATTPGLAARIDGNEQLRRRPIAALTQRLRELGADIRHFKEEGRLPLEITGRLLSGGRVEFTSPESSQFLSGLLLCAGQFENGLQLAFQASEQVSQSYVDLTIRLLEAFGVSCRSHQEGRLLIVEVPPRRWITGPAEYVVEPDAASASYLAAAALIMGGGIRLQGLAWETPQPEMGFFRILQRHGVVFATVEGALSIESGLPERPLDCDMADCSDTAMTMAVLASVIPGRSRIRGIAHNRFKESNRLDAFVAELRRAGIMAEATADGLEVEGSRRANCIPPDTDSRSSDAVTLLTHDDHRMVMALSLLGLRGNSGPSIGVGSPEAVAKSYPGFFSDLALLGITASSY